jgi:hypothetical protein
MNALSYAVDLSLKAARDEYFVRNRFGSDGGYSAAWVDFKLGPVPFPFPNTQGRVAAVRFHDLHHVVTQYATDFLGELEISAWEIGAGCKGSAFAWQINLGGLAGGMLLAPRRTAAAFYRGLGSHSLYGEDYDALLKQTVGDVRERLGLTRPVVPTWGGRARLALATVVGIGIGLLQFAILLPLVPIGLLMNIPRQRARALTSD